MVDSSETRSNTDRRPNEYLLSIIVPVYNVEKYIRSCIESIFRQSLDDNTFELIIVNDGTEDRSMEAIADIVNQHNNITVINQENLSLSVARNNGIAAAKGEYILMPDSDDLLIDGSLAHLLKKAIESKADLVVADFLEMDDEEIEHITKIPQINTQVIETTGKQIFLEYLNPHHCYVWRSLYRRAFLINNQLTFIPGIHYEDVPFTHECYLRAEKCLSISLYLYIYRRGHKSITFSFDKKKAKDFCIAIAKTWNLKHLDGLSPQIVKKLNNNMFSSFSSLLWLMLHCIKGTEDRREIISFFRKETSGLKFSGSIKQRVTTSLLFFSPRLYFSIRELFLKF